MTMTLVSTVTLTSTADSVVFNSVPQSGTDLLLVFSGRAVGTLNSTIDSANITTNLGNWTSIRTLQGNGSTASSNTVTQNMVGNSNTTASTFSNASLYLPNYASSVAKSATLDAVIENNATAATHRITALGTTATSAVTSLTITAQTSAGSTFAIGTTASLYTITKGSGGATVS